jgi:integrase
VRRERNLLNNALEIGRKEWGWIKLNPFERVRRPKDGQPKERTATDEEVRKILGCASDAMAGCISFSLETGMRASEIADLKEITGNVAILLDTKNGTRREVPLSAAAIAAWKEGGFGLTAGSISALFARYAKEAKIEGLTFHCLRRTAATRLSKKLTVWELCSMFGWKDPKIPMRHYYAPNTEEIARKL